MPLSLLVLPDCLGEKETAVVIVLQTIAANLGSMCTPVGNPQNLYLYFRSRMELSHFFALLLPYTLLSFGLLLLSVLRIPAKPLRAEKKPAEKRISAGPAVLGMLAVLFLLAMLTVAHGMNYRITLGMTVLAIGFWRPRIFREADYLLLLTFIAFFILVGNLGSLTWFRTFLARAVAGRELLTALLASQVISNVPAAMLLSGFTSHYEALLLGTDIGGLGTLTASMASLISYGLFSRAHPKFQGAYLKIFTLWNVLFLIPLVSLALLLE